MAKARPHKGQTRRWVARAISYSSANWGVRRDQARTVVREGQSLTVSTHPRTRCRHGIRMHSVELMVSIRPQMTFVNPADEQRRSRSRKYGCTTETAERFCQAH